MNATFRLRKGIFIQGAVCAAFFIVAVALHAALFFVDDAKRFGFKNAQAAVAMAWIGIALYGTMLFGSIWIIVAYFVEQFSIDGTTLKIRSVTQNQQFDATALRQVVWNCKSRGGKLTFWTATSKAVVHLHGYSVPDRLQIIRAVRELAPLHVQNGWDEFCHFVAIPLREGRRSRQPGIAFIDPATLPDSAKVYVTRRRYDRFFILLLLLTSIVSISLWQIWAIPQALPLPVLVLFFWIALRFSTPKRGRWDIKWSATKERKNLAIVHMALPVIFVSMVVFGLLGWNAMLVMYVGVLFLVALVVSQFRQARQRERDQRSRDEQETAISVERWDASEALD